MSNSSRPVVSEILTKTTEFLRSKKFENPRFEAEALLSSCWDWERIQLYLKFDQPLSEIEVSKARDWLKRRSLGEPLAYIQGYRHFYKSKFSVRPGVLIPRPETEIMVEHALQFLRTRASSKFRIIDLGTGTGCIGISIVKEFLQENERVTDEIANNKNGITLEATLVDIADEAICCAKENGDSLGVQDRLRVLQMDLDRIAASDLDDGTGYDLVVANPPYIDQKDSRTEESVRQFEPHLALFAENQGLAKIFRWAELAFSLLGNEGLAIFEIGLDQHSRALQHFREVGFEDVETIKDLQGIERFVRARKRS